MGELPYITVKQLAYKIKGTSNVLSARFAFLLGAGASRQSGIITASEMIRFFKERIIILSTPLRGKRPLLATWCLQT
jgi:hypothetical protein